MHYVAGSTGIGKTWMARAFGQKACRDGYTALFIKASELFRDLATARVDGSHGKLLYRLGRIDVLIVDDWAMAPLADIERRDFLEICDERYQAGSTLLTSQLPVAAWHAQSAIPPSPIVSSTGSYTTRIGWNSMVNQCARHAGAKRQERLSSAKVLYRAGAKRRGLKRRPLPSALPSPLDLPVD